jgi:hypothetical protein
VTRGLRSTTVQCRHESAYDSSMGRIASTVAVVPVAGVELETIGVAEVATSSLAEHRPVTIAEMRDRITE